MITKPMLAVAAKELKALRFPMIATPKLDGIRCLKVNGKVVSRSFKPIRNDFIRTTLERILPDGADGEIMVKGGDFQAITSGVMRSSGQPPFVFSMFDLVQGEASEPYTARLDGMRRWYEELKEAAPKDAFYVDLVRHRRVDTLAELLDYEDHCLTNGYEGVMVRTPESPYKCGRSTLKQQWLLKVKRFIDAEAEVIGYEEAMHNTNDAEQDAFGRTKRSSAKDGKVPAGYLGSLRVRDVVTGVEFGIGTGFDQAQREELWRNRMALRGMLVKYKSQPTGVKDAPRFPVFLEFRHPDDMCGA